MTAPTLLFTDTDILGIATQALEICVKLAGPPLIAALVTGLVVSLFQAVFQVQDQSLTMVPKMAAVAVALVVTGPWMMKQLVAFTTELYQSIPSLVG